MNRISCHLSISLALAILPLALSAQGDSQDLPGFDRQNNKFREQLEIAELWNSSVKAEEKKDYQGALVKLKQYSDSGGDKFMTSMRYSWIKSLQGEIEAAARSYDQAMRLNSKSVNAKQGWLNMQIALNSETGVMKGALQLLTVNPSSLQALKIVVAGYFNRGDFRTAETKIIPLLGKYPMDVDGLAYLTISRIRLGKATEALQSGIKFATLVPNYAESGILGAEIATTLGGQIAKTDSIRNHWNASIKSETDGNLSEAITHATNYAKAGGDRYFASMRAAWLHRSNDDAKNAYKFYRHAGSIARTAVNPKIGVLAMLVTLPDDGRKKDGINSAQRDLLSVLPVDYTAMVAIGDVEFSDENYRKSETLFNKIHLLYPMDATVLSYLSWSEYYNKHKKDAAESFTRLLSLSPGHADAEKGLSYSLDRPYVELGGGF